MEWKHCEGERRIAREISDTLPPEGRSSFSAEFLRGDTKSLKAEA
jgi:hypothetical protein